MLELIAIRSWDAENIHAIEGMCAACSCNTIPKLNESSIIVSTPRMYRASQQLQLLTKCETSELMHKINAFDSNCTLLDYPYLSKENFPSRCTLSAASFGYERHRPEVERKMDASHHPHDPFHLTYFPLHALIFLLFRCRRQTNDAVGL